MSNKKYGLNYERKEKKMLESEGHTAMRSRGSFGAFDIISNDGKTWYLTSVKATRETSKSYNQEVEKIMVQKVPFGTIKRVVCYFRGERKVVYQTTKEDECVSSS